MACCMTFPATFEEFAEDYKIVDSQEVYTNGAELIPIFRVKQWLQHEQACRDAKVKHGEWKEHFAYGCWHYDCPFCDDGFVTKERQINTPNYCQNCGAKMDGGKTNDGKG